MNYAYGACHGGIPGVLILHVSNPTHPTKDFYRDIFRDMSLVVGGLSRNIYMAHVMLAYQGR